MMETVWVDWCHGKSYHDKDFFKVVGLAELLNRSVDTITIDLDTGKVVKRRSLKDIYSRYFKLCRFI